MIQRNLAKKKAHTDPAPDWNNDTIGERLSKAAMALLLFGLIDEEEYKNINQKFDEYVNYHRTKE